MPKDPIKLYWWSRTDMVNLGDELGRDIVKFASGRDVVQTPIEQAEMLSIGSVLNFAQKDLHKRKNPYLVWGSGSLTAIERSRAEMFFCSAVRGPLTFSLLHQHRPIPFGDPGIITSMLWPHSEKKHRWGIVPHFRQLRQPWVKRMLESTPGAVLIDVRDPDIEASCRKIASCDFIASTSLHGLIIADSYGVPNLWLSDGDANGTWKYWDYFSGINRRGTLSSSVETSSVSVDVPSNLTEYESQFGNLRYMTSVPYLAKKLLEAFPL